MSSLHIYLVTQPTITAVLCRPLRDYAGPRGLRFFLQWYASLNNSGSPLLYHILVLDSTERAHAMCPLTYVGEFYRHSGDSQVHPCASRGRNPGLSIPRPAGLQSQRPRVGVASPAFRRGRHNSLAPQVTERILNNSSEPRLRAFSTRNRPLFPVQAAENVCNVGQVL